MTRAVDLFGGAGGWEEATAALGIDVLGIELDDAACATREARGHKTYQGDVSQLEPLNFGPVDGVIASAPCPTFSSAGKGGGRQLIADIKRCADAMAAGDDTREAAIAEAAEILFPKIWEAEQKSAKRKKRDPDRAAAQARAERDATTSLLVVEPLRWILALEPTWVALEQVPPVLELWQHYAGILKAKGYKVWAGILSAERYGVPQTRKRAILVAHRDRAVGPPTPTHQEFVPGEPAQGEHTLEGEVLPWVSMADALGWGEGLVGFPRRNDQPSNKPAGGDDGEYRARDFRSTDEPAFGLTEKARSWTLRAGTNENDAERRADQPAPTMRFGARLNTVAWHVADTGNTRGKGEVDPNSARVRDADEPAPSLTSRADQMERRPAASQPIEVRLKQPTTRRRALVSAGGKRGCVRAVGEPAPTMAFGNDSMEWSGDAPAGRHAGEHRGAPDHLNTGRDWKPGGGRDDAQKVAVDQPAPTLSARMGGQARWTHERPAPTIVGGRRSKDGGIVGRQLPIGEGENVGGWNDGETSEGSKRDEREQQRETSPRDPDWPAKRPATTVAGDPRIAQPGHKAEETSPGSPGRMEGAMRVTLQEAAVLQSFPPDYPFQGTRTKKFEQVGNAVPPLLAYRVLETLVDPAAEAAA